MGVHKFINYISIFFKCSGIFKTWLKIIKEVDIYKNSSLKSGRLVKIFQRLEKKKNYCFILDFKNNNMSKR